jgi:hypothetical protein
MLSTKYSPRRTRGRPRFDFSKLGLDAQRQLRDQGVKITGESATGRYKVAPVEDRTVGDKVFASKWEKQAYQMLVRAVGEDKVKCQPVFELQPAFTGPNGKKHRAINYVADFELTLPDGIHICDTKGHLTDIFKLKEKLFLFRYQLDLHKLYTPVQLREFLATHGVLLQF